MSCDFQGLRNGSPQGPCWAELLGSGLRVALVPDSSPPCRHPTLPIAPPLSPSLPRHYEGVFSNKEYIFLFQFVYAAYRPLATAAGQLVCKR